MNISVLNTITILEGFVDQKIPSIELLLSKAIVVFNIGNFTINKTNNEIEISLSSEATNSEITNYIAFEAMIVAKARREATLLEKLKFKVMVLVYRHRPFIRTNLNLQLFLRRAGLTYISNKTDFAESDTQLYNLKFKINDTE